MQLVMVSQNSTGAPLERQRSGASDSASVRDLFLRDAGRRGETTEPVHEGFDGTSCLGRRQPVANGHRAATLLPASLAKQHLQPRSATASAVGMLWSAGGVGRGVGTVPWAPHAANNFAAEVAVPGAAGARGAATGERARRRRRHSGLLLRAPLRQRSRPACRPSRLQRLRLRRLARASCTAAPTWPQRIGGFRLRSVLGGARGQMPVRNGELCTILRTSAA